MQSKGQKQGCWLMIGFVTIIFTLALIKGQPHKSAPAIHPVAPVVIATAAPVATAEPSPTPVPLTPDQFKTVFNSFRSTVGSLPGIGEYIADIQPGSQINVIVTDKWFFLPKQLRLQYAQNIWKAWAGFYSPQNPDEARITLRDRNGNNVGGSGWLAGSMIEVKD